MAGATRVDGPVNSTVPQWPAEDEELYTQLLRLQDVVLAGRHPSLKLPAPAIERLKAALLGQQHLYNSAFNDTSFSTNHTHPQQPPPFLTFDGLAGSSPAASSALNRSAEAFSAKTIHRSGLDPIFLEKSDSLIRAEGQLKRQRLDRDLQAQVDQRKHSSRDKDPGVEAPSPLDIGAVLLSALERVKPISGLRDADKSSTSSSFDENDYYSSQVQSDWSSEASAGKGSDKAADAFTADFERLDGYARRPSLRNEAAAPALSGQQNHKDYPHVYVGESEDAYEVGDEDDEYTPPDAAAFDSFRENVTDTAMGQTTPVDDDDNSEYEPGEITDTNLPTPPTQVQQSSPRVPVIRNHLTHIVAPQPNRVSPLATAKGPTIELELVNGRPELVQKPKQNQNVVHSRASTASPSGNGAGGSGKKRRNKKRKRDAEPHGRAKRRRERQAAVDTHSRSAHDQPYIKDEPISPPPFASVPDAPQYRQPHTPLRVAEVDLTSPRYAPPPYYMTEPQGSGLRYEQIQPTSPSFVQVAPSSSYRPIQRDTQDLRRVASLHTGQPPNSLLQRGFSPVAPYRTASMTYGDSNLNQARRENQRISAAESNHYTRIEHSRSPPRDQEYRGSYAVAAPSPTLMPPPAAPQRKVIIDQNGNRYYAAEPVPAPTPASIPTSRSPAVPPSSSHEQRPSLSNISYDQLPQVQSLQYEMMDHRMAPPPQATRKDLMPQQLNSNGYYAADHTSRAPEPLHYAGAPTSPVYQQFQGYPQIPAIPQQQKIPQQTTSPLYAQPRSYSVRPAEPQPLQTQAQAPSTYLRHASVAPVQYIRQDAASAPLRAVSVMPGGSEHTASSLLPQQQLQQPSQRAYSQAPQQHGVRYVDQYGNEVFPREVREVRY